MVSRLNPHCAAFFENGVVFAQMTADLQRRSWSKSWDGTHFKTHSHCSEIKKKKQLIWDAKQSWEVWNTAPEATGEISAALGEKWVNLKYSLQDIDLTCLMTFRWYLNNL